jgi:coenzyme PQQ precursor peptide PqqA
MAFILLSEGAVRDALEQSDCSQFSCQPIFWRRMMQWTTPAFTDLRFGFEITMYIANR